MVSVWGKQSVDPKSQLGREASCVACLGQGQMVS